MNHPSRPKPTQYRSSSMKYEADENHERSVGIELYSFFINENQNIKIYLKEIQEKIKLIPLEQV